MNNARPRADALGQKGFAGARAAKAAKQEMATAIWRRVNPQGRAESS